MLFDRIEQLFIAAAADCRLAGVPGMQACVETVSCCMLAAIHRYGMDTAVKVHADALTKLWVLMLVDRFCNQQP